MKKDKLLIVGAGLVGSLLATLLAKKGFSVQVFEKRADPRKNTQHAGRSINLALSHRGIQALKKADVFSKIAPLLIPMSGRKMHDEQGNLTYQPYGKEGQHINSVSRNELNKTLINAAESHGVAFFFEHTCEHIDLQSNELNFQHGNETVPASADFIFGTDGAFSVVRSAMQRLDRFNFSQHYIEHGYKELHMPPKNGDFAMEPNYLHIWPRGKFMLIALPNPDKTFTCTLFLSFEGATSFASLQTDAAITGFFEQHFPDILPHFPDLVSQFKQNPTSSLVTVRCSPWVHRHALILGDAAHAIVPFYGQGMNAGFEDCRLLMEMAEEHEFDWSKILPLFANNRKKDADAIADLALKNFVEMRDWVGDETFLIRKQIEAKLHEAFPSQWVPQYTMVTFTDTPYSEAWEKGKNQDRVMNEVLNQLDDTALENLDLSEIIHKL